MPTPRIIHADCLDALRDLPDESAHAVVTDPPYGLANTDSPHVMETLSRWFAGERDYLPAGAGFMGKAWDAFVPPPAVWDECYRVLKPGGHLLAFAGSRTQDLMGLSIRLAGFDLRDTITWLYGSGFPKSLDVGKAIDKAAGATREVVATERSPFRMADKFMGDAYMSTQTGDTRETDADGYIVKKITAPATPEAQQWDGWGTALKPASEPIVVARKPPAGTVATNVLAHGTGALNIDACRVGWRDTQSSAGRWPANVVLDEHAAAALDQQTGDLGKSAGGFSASTGAFGKNGTYGHAAGIVDEARTGTGFGDSGGASRFFPVFRYQAKAPQRERPSYVDEHGVKQAHNTVKPLEAALLEGFDVVAVEREADYLPLIQQRIDRVTAATEQVEDEPEGLW